MLLEPLQRTEEELLTSPICTRDSHIHPGKFKWADGIMHIGTNEDPLPGPNAHSEFGIAEFACSDLLSICDVTALEYRKTLVLPFISQPNRPRRRPIRIPCVFKPFASFEVTELAVQQLRATLRRVGQIARNQPVL
jgi:hypothetical protein